MARRSSLCQPLIVASLALVVYVVFLATTIVPQAVHLVREGNAVNTIALTDDPHVAIITKSQFLGIVISFHILLALFVTSYVRALLTPAGHVPHTPFWREKEPSTKFISAQENTRLKRLLKEISRTSFDDVVQWLRSLIVVERKQKQLQLRWCRSCKHYKPDRTHHCDTCGECVLRMDHHCPWIANCVGYFNYKFFLLVLFYGIVNIFFIMAAMLPRLVMCFRPFLSWEYFFEKDFWVAFIYLPLTIVFCGLVVFFSFHFYLVCRSFTTIEYREKYNSNDRSVQHRFRTAHQKYDRGYYGNFTAVFGPWYMWLLPIMPEQMDGVHGTYPAIPIPPVGAAAVEPSRAPGASGSETASLLSSSSSSSSSSLTRPPSPTSSSSAPPAATAPPASAPPPVAVSAPSASASLTGVSASVSVAITV